MKTVLTVKRVSFCDNINAMFFDEDNPDIIHVVHRDFYAIHSNLKFTRYGLRTVPTHTEDGIPIRKLYVSNLPPKTTRTELFNLFAQYGFIKSCWLRMGDRGTNKSSTPTYAFVTFSDPNDAHKALQAPSHETILRGRNLRISPADSWHQPAEDVHGRVRWMPHGRRRIGDLSPASHSNDAQDYSVAEPGINEEASNVNKITKSEEASNSQHTNNILDILNTDCLTHIMTFVPLKDLIRSERVSKSWHNMIQDYFQGIRTFKTSWWEEPTVCRLTTAVLRSVLQRLGGGLLRLHLDHHLNALNDRTAHTIGKFCPSLEELKVVGMYTKNWNPLVYGCKQLKNLSFVSCNKLTDSSLVHLVKNDSCIEVLTVVNNTHVTGLFLTGSNALKLHSLSFYNCYSLQGTVLCAAIDTLPNLTTLKLDVCPITMWKIIPLILKKLPNLEELSVSEYISEDPCPSSESNDSFCESLATLNKLKSLNLSRNIYINNAVLKQIAQSCCELESLNVSCCNSTRNFPHTGVSDEGIRAVCTACSRLTRLDVSYLSSFSGQALATARLPRLRHVTARGNRALAVPALAALLAHCGALEELDLCGCENVSGELVGAAVSALQEQPRSLTLRLAATAASVAADCGHVDFPTHQLLTVNLHEDRSNPILRPDFLDDTVDRSDDYFDDLYDHEIYEDFDDIFDQEDELMLNHDDNAIGRFYAYGIHAADIILL